MRKNRIALSFKFVLMIAAFLLPACSHYDAANIRADSDDYIHTTLYVDGGLREVFNKAYGKWGVHHEVFGIFHEHGASLGFIDPSRGYVWLAGFKPEDADVIRVRVYELKAGKHDMATEFREVLGARDSP